MADLPVDLDNYLIFKAVVAWHGMAWHECMQGGSNVETIYCLPRYIAHNQLVVRRSMID